MSLAQNSDKATPLTAQGQLIPTPEERAIAAQQQAEVERQQRELAQQ